MVPLLFRLGRRGRTGTGAMMPGVLDWSTDDAEEESERAISGIRGDRTCSCVCVPSSIGDVFVEKIRPGGLMKMLLCDLVRCCEKCKFSKVKVGEEDGVGFPES